MDYDTLSAGYTSLHEIGAYKRTVQDIVIIMVFYAMARVVVALMLSAFPLIILIQSTSPDEHSHHMRDKEL